MRRTWHSFLAQSTNPHTKPATLMRTFLYQLCAVIHLSFLKVKSPLSWQHVDVPGPTIHQIGWFSASLFGIRLVMQRRVLINGNTITERFEGVFVQLNRVMTALWRLGKFNLTVLMSSFISLVFCCSKRFFFLFSYHDLLNKDTPLIRTLSAVPSVSVLTGFDCNNNNNNNNNHHHFPIQTDHKI